DDLEFYDYEAKYFGKGTVSIDVPADLPAAQLEAVREEAARAFAVLGLERLARFAGFVSEDGPGLATQVNTMPRLTPYSMLPVLWAHMGLPYSELITDLVEQARRRRLGPR